MKKWIVLLAVLAAIPTLSYAQDADLFRLEKKVAYFDSGLNVLGTPDTKATLLDSRRAEDQDKIGKFLNVSATDKSPALVRERACVSQAIDITKTYLEKIKIRSDYIPVAAAYEKTCGPIANENFLIIAAAGLGLNAGLRDMTNVRIWVGKGKENGDLAGQISMTASTPDFRYMAAGDDANCSNLKKALTGLDFKKVGDTVIALIKRDTNRCTPIDDSASNTDDSSDSGSTSENGSSGAGAAL